jgi:hypothetical protein
MVGYRYRDKITETCSRDVVSQLGGAQNDKSRVDRCYYKATGVLMVVLPVLQISHCKIS